jgi:membrane associated rhomboid family serine protease
MDQAVCCYRHPDRETAIRCARCDRPICPDCMVSASVGYQCPNCLYGQQRQRPAPLTLAGGAVASNPRLVTILLIAVNIVVFLAVQARPVLVDQWGLFPPAIAGGQWYRLFTAIFLHQALAHVGLNMLSLWWIGPPVEAALGRVRYLALYLLAGLGGSALSYWLAPANELGLGASGAIFGLLGALFVLLRRVNADLKPIIILIVLNLVFSFTIRDIDWRAHVGGLVTGAVVAYGMVHAPRERRALVQWGTCVGMLAVVCVVLAVATMKYTG